MINLEEKIIIAKKEGEKLVRIHVRFNEDRIENIRITGDFFIFPEEKLSELENLLFGQKIIPDDILGTIKNFLKNNNVTFAGISPETISEMIQEAYDDTSE